MTTTQVNVLNIALMLGSLAAAWVLPFEVFLLSYAILGPLHYLTEISWLHDRHWFSPRRLDWAPLLACAVLVSLGVPDQVGTQGQAVLDRLGVGRLLGDATTDLTFLAFGLALLFVITRDLRARVAGALLLLLTAWWLHLPASASPEALLGSLYWKVFAAYLTTIVHVFVFTGAFILWGALKGRSVTGHLSFAVFLGCAAACFALPPVDYVVSGWARTNYDGNFLGLSQMLLHDLFRVPIGELGSLDMFRAGISVVLMRFVAFAYTYHYLNWFSKTSVIRWHEVPRSRFVLVGIVWAASLALYAWDYAAGLRWLFALSFAHVLLEFPLNHLSFLGIGRELRSRLRWPVAERA